MGGVVSHCKAFVKECAKPFDVYHMLLSMSVNPVSHLNMAVVHFYFLFYALFSSPQKEFQHLFNKSEKGCKQNALCCSNRDWRAFKKPRGDIKAMHLS